MANMKIGTRLRCSVEEAAELLQVVSVFKLDGALAPAAHAKAAAPRRVVASAPPKRPAPPLPTAGRPALHAVPSQRQSAPRDDEWEVF